MSKNKNHNTSSTTPIQLTNGTILEQFQDYVKDHKKVSDIIGFLSIQNARLLRFGNDVDNIPADLGTEIVEFVAYFLENYDDVTREARYENWGDQDARIIRAANAIYENNWMKERMEIWNSLPDIQKHEAETLRDTIMDIRADRIISAVDGDGDSWQFEIPHTIYREYLQSYKDTLLLYLAKSFLYPGGGIMVRLIKRSSTELFGIQVLPIGIWRPLPKEETIDAHTLTLDGERIPPEKGLIYTEIVRERI
jgi:hypothetical protein